MKLFAAISPNGRPLTNNKSVIYELQFDSVAAEVHI
jgi:hypothetical protein